MAGDACRVRPLATVCGRLRVWRDAGVFSALLEGLLAEAAREGIRTCRWSASTPPRLVPVTTPPGCASARTSWTTSKKPLVNRRKPGKKGRAGGTERKGCATTRPAPTQAPAEGSPARQVPRWTHQQGPSRRGPQMPSAHVRPGRGQSAIHPRAQEGEGSPAHRPPPPRTRPGAVAADKTYSSRSNHAYLRKCNIKTVIPETKDQTANRKKKGSTGGRPVSHNADLYKERNTVERLINKVKAWRGVATDETGPAGWQAWAESMLGAPPLPVGCLIRFQCAARPRGSLRRLPRLDGPGSAACAARGHTGATAAGPGSGPPTARRSPPSSVPSSTGTTEQGRPGAVRCWRRTRAGSARRPGGPGSCSRHAAS